MHKFKITTLAMALVAIFSIICLNTSVQAKIVPLQPIVTDSVKVERVNQNNFTFFFPESPELLAVYDSLYVDTLYEYDVVNLVEYLTKLDSSFDSSEAAVNSRIAERMKALEAEKANRKQLIADSLLAEEKKFWAEVDSVQNEIPKVKKISALVNWVDDPIKAVAVLQNYRVAKKDIDINLGVSEYHSQIRQAAVTMSMIQHHTVELDGITLERLRRALEGLRRTDSLVLAQLTTNVEFLTKTNAQTILNAENIDILCEKLDETAINSLVALSQVDFAKINKKVKDDAKELKRNLNSQVKRNYEPIKLSKGEEKNTSQ